MDKVLVDTNIASYLMKKHPLSVHYKNHLEGRILCLSFISIGEFYLGAEMNNWGEKRKKELDRILMNYVVLPYEVKVARCYAKIVMSVRRKKNQIDFPDAWIAATALAFNIPLVTHNIKHFQHIPELVLITECYKDFGD